MKICSRCRRLLSRDAKQCICTSQGAKVCHKCHAIYTGALCPCKDVPRVDTRKHGEGNRIYDHRWMKLAKSFLRVNPWCAMCGQPARDVDHITPHDGDKNLMYQVSNLQSLCRGCHVKKTWRDTKARRAKDEAENV